MYKSPIEVITNQMRTQIEDYIFNTIQEVGVSVDKEELIKALKYDREQYAIGYTDGLNTNKWVSIDDKLPERHERVLCYHKYEPNSPDVICENTYYGGGRWLSDGSKVTHWMPLPEPPTEKEN